MKLSKVGVVGAGQLGQMMALAGYPLGLSCLFLDRSDDTPGARVAPTLIGELDDPACLKELAARSDVLTFDWENVSGQALAPIEKSILVRPPRRALEASQDRLREKALFKSLRIPVAAHAAVDSRADLLRAIRRLGCHGILKTRRLGYDGKGQHLIARDSDIDEAWDRIGARELIYERFQAFSREVSLIAARSAAGEIVYYPLALNTHSGGVLRYSIAPFHHPSLERMATRYMRRVLESLQYVGVLAIEFFVVKDRLVANEMAPRVHNSGHWTIEGCVTSQFENHLRAICDLPLGNTRPLGHAAMINFLGQVPAIDPLLAIEGLAFHDYGKAPRAGRKLGHCTIVRAGARERNRVLSDVIKLIEWT